MSNPYSSFAGNNTNQQYSNTSSNTSSAIKTATPNNIINTQAYLANSNTSSTLNNKHLSAVGATSGGPKSQLNNLKKAEQSHSDSSNSFIRQVKQPCFVN
jgi:hypothetical protein